MAVRISCGMDVAARAEARRALSSNSMNSGSEKRECCLSPLNGNLKEDFSEAFEELEESLSRQAVMYLDAFSTSAFTDGTFIVAIVEVGRPISNRSDEPLLLKNLTYHCSISRKAFAGGCPGLPPLEEGKKDRHL